MLSFFVAAATVFYIAAPLRQARVAEPNVPAARQRESILRLEARREAVLRDLKDLEFDFRMQKFEASEYAELRASMAAEASEVLQRLEEVRGSQSKSSQPKSGEKRRRETPSAVDMSTTGEAAVAARLAAEIEIEVMIARARRRLAQPASTTNGAAQSILDDEKLAQSEALEDVWRCACGREMTGDDRFCASCGAARSVE